MAQHSVQKANPLLQTIVGLIEQSRQRVALAVNAELSLLYWNIGKQIHDDLLHSNRADYGKKVVDELSRELSQKYGNGFSKRNIHNFIKFHEIYTDSQIVQTVSAQLSWSHITTIIYIQDDLKREFYTRLCVYEKWSIRTLRERIDSMMYERTAISKKPETAIKSDLELLKKEQKLSPDLTFRDPYFLDFLGLRDAYSEKDLETAILANLQLFLTELGTDFAFLARQKRITIDDEDYYIDLLFYHRSLKRLIAIDLKLGKFKATYKGQMELYLRWLEVNEQKEGENTPIGLILCSEKSPEQINYLMLDNHDNIKLAEYITELPDRKLLKEKLQTAIDLAQNNLK